MTENFDHWMNVLNNTLGRIAEALEKSCSDSHAPSNPSSHGPSAPGGVSPSSPSSSSSGPAGATGSSDSARRALADKANWPTWLTREAASTLPEGTERVYPSPNEGAVAAYPGDHYWSNGVWCPRGASLESGRDRTKVYHLPPAAKGEGDAWSRWMAKYPMASATPEQVVEFNAFVAGECERAVREAFPITAKAGRCAACKDTILDMGVRTGGEWYHNACAPKPSPGEVAEGIVAEYASHYGPMFDREMLKAMVEAAIVRERTPHV